MSNKATFHINPFEFEAWFMVLAPWAFMLVALLMFCLAFGYYLLEYSSQPSMRQRSARLVRNIGLVLHSERERRGGELPLSERQTALKAFKKLHLYRSLSVHTNDSWGRPIEVLLLNNEIIVRSAGEDSVFSPESSFSSSVLDAGDDIVWRESLPTTSPSR